MRSVEKDAKERAEDRKRRNERAETYKRIANGAFGLGDYEKAITYYTKALEQRKDSALLWNNRALSYMRLALYETALGDLEWALKVNDSNIKALLNSAKCHSKLSNESKRDEFLQLARQRNPRFTNYINGRSINVFLFPFVQSPISIVSTYSKIEMIIYRFRERVEKRLRFGKGTKYRQYLLDGLIHFMFFNDQRDFFVNFQLYNYFGAIWLFCQRIWRGVACLSLTSDKDLGSWRMTVHSIP